MSGFLQIVAGCLILSSCTSHYIYREAPDWFEDWKRDLPREEQTIRLRDGMAIRGATVFSVERDLVSYEAVGGRMTVPLGDVVAFTEEEDSGASLTGFMVGLAAGLVVSEVAFPRPASEGFIDLSSAARQLSLATGAIVGGLVGVGIGTQAGKASHRLMTHDRYIRILPDSLITTPEGFVRFRWGEGSHEIPADSVQVDEDGLVRVNPSMVL